MPEGEALSHGTSRNTILSDCAKVFVEIKRRNEKRNLAENLIILFV